MRSSIGPSTFVTIPLEILVQMTFTPTPLTILPTPLIVTTTLVAVSPTPFTVTMAQPPPIGLVSSYVMHKHCFSVISEKLDSQNYLLVTQQGEFVIKVHKLHHYLINLVLHLLDRF